jgi:hypothetical protein
LINVLSAKLLNPLISNDFSRTIQFFLEREYSLLSPDFCRLPDCFLRMLETDNYCRLKCG